MKTDLELQLALAKMLPEKLQPVFVGNTSVGTDANKGYWVVWWKSLCRSLHDTEWLHVCWLIEQGLDDIESQKLKEAVYAMHKAKVRLAYSASWQQRAAALIAVKGEK